ncbi:MAG: hypothetical protein LC746_00170 [Acidobacteria bacterium]|nr:hypothetical protein [Acidobacteriota bacterium]
MATSQIATSRALSRRAARRQAEGRGVEDDLVARPGEEDGRAEDARACSRGSCP